MIFSFKQWLIFVTVEFLSRLFPGLVAGIVMHAGQGVSRRTPEGPYVENYVPKTVHVPEVGMLVLVGDSTHIIQSQTTIAGYQEGTTLCGARFLMTHSEKPKALTCHDCHDRHHIRLYKAAIHAKA
jgi:hypothetical protein